ncbi:putative MFS efflux transporter [Aspergillus alliaceus]|uniref:putative MFS efflux transporter n=1 Tax=Petromyces alliaceus TaxID=209559 RepID=UPI0012A4328C|nr:major facilitator superfamily domain-containing protein [Aspergillus alliaceus]KAB8235086.1 major facilitator superfamily domain-containing protein [Aspergillus alliaceus]
MASFFLLGFGLELQLALNNVFCANLANATTALGFLHGSYEISGIMGPLIAPALAFHGDRWSFYYALTMALAGYEKELPVQLLTALQQNASHQEHERGVSNQKHSLKQAVKTRTTLLGALFIFAYQGAEFYRGGDPSRVGYMSAGLWAGITLGRFVLSRLAHMIEEKLSIVTRLIPNVIGDVVAVALVGLLLGPVYPCATTVFSKLLPRSIQVSSLNFIVH